MQLSVVIITFNEERNIGRCLSSVKDIADDIVVVDSFSTDRTETIAREQGARFVTHAFAGHIAQKNWAVAQAQHPWVLSLDADEALGPELQASIRQAKQRTDADGFTMHRLTNYCGTWIRHGGWYPDTKLRMWNSTKGKWGGTDPHDRYEMQAGARVVHLHGDLLHHSYSSISEHLRQVDHFTTIASKALFAQGKRAGLLKLLVSPCAKFISGYLLGLGFLDGFHGFVIARISASATFVKYAKLRQLWRERK